MGEEKNMQREPEKSDIELVELFQAGEKQALDILVLRYQNRVFRTCLRMLGNYDEANDSAQEVFIKIFRSLNRFKRESKFSTWLYRIAINTCKNKLVSLNFRRKKKTISIDAPVENKDGVQAMEIHDETLSPGFEVNRREKAVLIQRAINSLSDEHKEIVILRDIEGLSYEDIAGTTGYTLGTVKSKLARAREQLRTKLKELV